MVPAELLWKLEWAYKKRAWNVFQRIQENEECNQDTVRKIQNTELKHNIRKVIEERITGA